MNSKIFTLFIVLVLLITGCSKDKEIDQKLLQNTRLVQPFDYLMKSSKLTDTLHNFYGGIHELGLRFRSLNDAYIHEVGMMTPVNGRYKMSIWDMETREVLRSTTVQTIVNEFTFGKIETLKIEAGKEYVISFNTNYDGVAQRYYQARKKAGDILYPFSAYGIQFLDFRYISGSETKFPLAVPELEQDQIPGLIDFKIDVVSQGSN